MKKILLKFSIIVLILFGLYQNTFAVVSQVATLPSAYGTPKLSINNGNKIYYVLKDNAIQGYVRIYDETGTLIDTINRVVGIPANNSVVIESNNNIYFIAHNVGSSNSSDGTEIFKYNKINDTFSEFQNLAWEYSGQAYPYDFLPRIIMDGDNLIIRYNDSKGYTINTLDNSVAVNASTTVTSSITYANMEQLKDNYYYRVSLNNINYLDEALKTYNYVLVDTVGDVIRLNDVFVSTWDFSGYKMLYDTDSDSFYLSIYGNTDNMRAYYNYELGNADYLDDRYYSETFSGQLVKINTQATMGYNFAYGIHNPLINLIDKGAGPTFYFVDSANLVYKDSDLDTSNLLIDFYDSTGGGGDTGTGTTVDVESIFDTDLNGDGETSITEGLKSIFLIPARIFASAGDYIAKVKEIVDTFLNQTEPVFKDITSFRFIESTNAGFFTELITNTEDRLVEEDGLESQNQSILHKYKNMLQYGLYFLIVIFLISLYISNKKNND